MISETVVALAHWQFALTSAFHLVFIPLNLGLSALLALTESGYVFSGNIRYKIACRFWARIFAVNFVLGWCARLGMAFQFGMQDAYFSHYLGDVFFLPLGIELLSSFFLAAGLFGPFVYGWDCLGKGRHLLITWLLTLAVHVSALWLLISQDWLKNPLGATFNYQSYRLELTDFGQILDNPTAANQVLNGIFCSYLLAAAAILAISAGLLLKNLRPDIGRHGFRFAAIFGLLASLGLGVMHLPPQPANAWQDRMETALSDDNKNPAIDIAHLRNGMKAYSLLLALRDENKDPQLLADFAEHSGDLGYVLLLKRWTEHLVEASDKQLAQAALATQPAHPQLTSGLYHLPTIGIWLTLPGLLLAALYSRKDYAPPTWLLKLVIYLGPLPWLAIGCGWLATELCKQPWAVFTILPSFLSASSLAASDLWLHLGLDVIAAAALLGLGAVLLRLCLQDNPNPHSTRGDHEF